MLETNIQMDMPEFQTSYGVYDIPVPLITEENKPDSRFWGAIKAQQYGVEFCDEDECSEFFGSARW